MEAADPWHQEIGGRPCPAANVEHRSFAKSSGFAVGLFFLNFIFVPILGFGQAQYVGPAAGRPRAM